MTGARALASPGRRSARVLLFAAVVAAHLLLLALLLREGPDAIPGVEPATLALFEPLPPPPEPLPPPPPPEPAAIAGRQGGGGSPGVRRELPAERTPHDAPPQRAVMDATPVPAAPPSLALDPAGSALADLGAGGAGGVGTGTGSGTGPGSGAGRGRGEGGGTSGEVFARAEWVRRPTLRDYLRYWPPGERLPDFAITMRLTCRVRRSGTPHRCRMLSERPANTGFGRTVLGAVAEAKIRPVAMNGDPAWDLPVLITIVLDTLDLAPPVTAAASAPPAR